MDKKQCGECSLTINELEPIRCGFCDTHFHISQQCCGFNNRSNRELFTNGKAMFICPKCRTTLNGRSVCSYLKESIGSQSSSPLDLDELFSQVKKLTSLVESLSKQVENIVNERPPARPLSTPNWPKTGVKRRRGNNGQAVQAPAERGTNTIDLTDLSVQFIVPPPPAPKFWLYLSGFQPLIKVEDVQKIVSRCMNVADPVDVVRLVAKDADVTKLSFVSFKIGLNPDCQELALDASTWPAGLLFREFEEQSNKRRADRVPVEIPLDNAMDVIQA